MFRAGFSLSSANKTYKKKINLIKPNPFAAIQCLCQDESQKAIETTNIDQY